MLMRFVKCGLVGGVSPENYKLPKFKLQAYIYKRKNDQFMKNNRFDMGKDTDNSIKRSKKVL
jgi:hypothetical protein